MKRIEQILAEKVNNAGGKAYYVGGFVRDKILGIESKDIDIEVHGLTPVELLEILDSIGEYDSYGRSFGVYSLKGHDIDIAMPRCEYATGRGHKDFEVYVDPFIGETEAARRRDFTMNAIMVNILTGEIIDPFNGHEDIANHIIRHVDDDKFAEDPLRVLRTAQFSSRFGFRIADETTAICRKIDLSSLSKERVEEELKKALLKSMKPSAFFVALRNMEQLDEWFPELKMLIGLEQDPKFHPEGDVWTHTMGVIDRASQYRDKVVDPYAFMMLSLTHDFGKIDTTEKINGRIHSYRHETEGLPRIESFLDRITGNKSVKKYVLNMVPLHMKPNVAAYYKPAVKSTNKMFNEALEPLDLIYFAMSDKPVMSGDNPFTGDSEFLFERYRVFKEIMARPFVTGKDLIEAGLEPGIYFSDVLSHSHKLRLAGIEKESALKQTLAYARKKYHGHTEHNR